MVYGKNISRKENTIPEKGRELVRVHYLVHDHHQQCNLNSWGNVQILLKMPQNYPIQKARDLGYLYTYLKQLRGELIPWHLGPARSRSSATFSDFG